MKTEIKIEPSSYTSDDEIHEHNTDTEIKVKPGISITDENKYKQMFTNALHYAVDQLKEQGVITCTASNMISTESERFGREICKCVKDIYIIHEPQSKFTKVKGEAVTATESELNFEAVPQLAHHKNEGITESFFSRDEDFTFKEATMSHDMVPWDMKVKAVTLATLFPKWSLQTIRKKTTHHLRTAKQLSMWKQSVRKNTRSENSNLIAELTYQRFLDAYSKNQPITIKMLRNWGIEASQQFLSASFKFNASDSWIFKLKRKYNIRECKVTGFLKM